MSQLNLHTTPEFDHQLKKYMKICGLHTKAEAIRAAVKESLEHHLSHSTAVDFKSWIGQGLIFPPHKPRFKSEDELWESDK